MNQVEIYKLRPFKSRNAEEFALREVLDLFVNPASELQNPFEFENALVKGRMGSGKTMFLRANLAYHLYTVIPSLVENAPLLLPVFIRLSDFQHLVRPSEIYRGVILRIIEELSKVYLALQDCDRMADIHRGMQSLPEDYLRANKLATVLRELTRLSSEQYVQTIKDKLGLSGSAKPKFFEIAANFEKERIAQFTQKAQPGIADVRRAYEMLLADRGGNILLLVDEAGSIPRSFFSQEKQTSLFETLMNQLRTTEFIRTKIAIYPHTYSDVLPETRYGDLVSLFADVVDETSYKQFRRKVIALIERYLSAAAETSVPASLIFEITEGQGDALEQIINASGGNMRRLMELLDLSMGVAFEEHAGIGTVTTKHVTEALNRHSSSTEALYTPHDREFLNAIAQTCKSRRTCRFQFPNKTPALYKYTSKSDEHNILNVTEAGSGRRGTTYSFDYAYAVQHDLPTHYVKGTEKIDETRSRSTGEWISRVAQNSDELVQHATLFAKIEGIIDYVEAEQKAAVIRGDDSCEYLIFKSELIQSDRNQPLIVGRRVKFSPMLREEGEMPLAAAAELL